MHMKFSEDSQHSYFFSQPHQPFFVLAFISAIVTMLIFLLSYKGVIHMSISPSDYHTYGFTYLLFTPAFFGFLFTTFPRFTSTPAIEKSVYLRVFNFYYIGATLFLLGSIVSPFLSAIGMIIVFIGHLLGYLILKNIYTITPMEDKHDVYWISQAMLIGVIAHFIFILGQLFFPTMVGFSSEISTYLFLFLLTFTVGQRMIPFFSHCMVDKNMTFLRSIFILLVLHIFFEGMYTNSSFYIDMFLAYYIGKELLRWKLPFPNTNPLLSILHIALFWVPVSFGLSGLANFITILTDVHFLALDTHVIILGFVLTTLIGFGTRVTLGHSGNNMQSDKLTTLIFAWTQVVVVLRILVSFVAAFGVDFMVLFDITATAWILLFIVWAVRFFMVLIQGKKLTD